MRHAFQAHHCCCQFSDRIAPALYIVPGGHTTTAPPKFQIMCYCFQIYEQPTLQLQMCATTGPTHELRLNRVLPGNLLSGGLCKINELCTVVYKLSFLWRVGYDVLGLEDKMNARLFEHRWFGDGLRLGRIGRILFVTSDYPVTDCSLGHAR